MSSRIQVQLRKNTVTVVPVKVITDALASRQDGEGIQVTVYPGAVLVVYPDGSSVDEIERLIAAEEARAS